MEMSLRAAGVGVSVGVGALLTWWAWRRTHTYPQTPIQWEEVGEVAELVIYPLRLGRGVKVTEAEATRYGLGLDLLEDRSFVAVTSGYATWEELVYRVTLTLEGSMVTLQAKGEKTLKFDLEDVIRAGQVTDIMGYSSSFGKGYDCGDEAAAWLTRVIQRRGKEFRLAYNGDLTCDKQPTESSRIVVEGSNVVYTYAHFKPSDRVVYADDAPYMLTSETSLEDLNSRLIEPANQDYFKPNIVVRGVRQPYDEDDWAFVRIGEVVLRRLKPCERIECLQPVTCYRDYDRVDIVRKTLAGTRVMAGPEVLQRHWKNYPPFGSYLGIDRCGRVRVGDKVEVARASSNPQWQF